MKVYSITMSYRKLKRKRKASLILKIELLELYSNKTTVFPHQFIQCYVIQSYSAHSGVSSVIIQLFLN